MKRLIGTLLVASITMASSGCFKGEEDTCEFWTDKLAKSSAVDRALKKVGELRCSTAVPVLQKLYEDGQFQESILRTLKEIGDKPAAVPILKMALRAEGFSKLAADIITEWRLTETKDELVKILTDDKLAESREAALTALLSFEEPKNLEDTLITLAGYDPNIQGIAVNARAIQELGKLGSVKAIPTLLKMAFARTNKMAEVYRDVRAALAQIGTGVREKVEAVMAGTDTEVKAYTRAAGVQDWETRYGPKSAQLLADTLDPAAVPALAKSLADELVPPTGVSEKALELWINGQKTRLKVIMLGLAHIGGDQAVPTLITVTKDANADTRGQRLNAAFALAVIGSEAAQAGLIDAWKVEPTPEFRRPLVGQLALALDYTTMNTIQADLTKYMDELKATLTTLDAKVEEIKGKIAAGPDEATLATLKQEEMYAVADRDTFKMTVEQASTYLAVTAECQDNEGCWIGKLKSADQNEQVKALVLLARGKVGDHQRVVDALLQAFSQAAPTALDAKRFALVGLTRLGNAAVGARVLKLIEGLEEKDIYWRDELTAIGHYLSRRK